MVDEQLGRINETGDDKTRKFAFWHRFFCDLEVKTGCDYILIDLNPSISMLNKLAILACVWARWARV